MARPGEGASLTLGEAAAYARGRAAGLREAAGVANQHAAVGAGHYAGTAILALLDGAAAGDALQRERDRLAIDLLAARGERDMTGGELAAARARIAELEREVERLKARGFPVQHATYETGRREGAEAMREAAARSIESIAFPDEWLIVPVAARIRMLPLPQEAGA